MKKIIKEYFYIKNFNTETNKKKNVLLLIAAVYLLLAWQSHHWPYGFYTLLRFVVAIASGYVALILNAHKKGAWVWCYGFIAILFNPIVPIHFPKDVWSVINLLTAIVMIYSIFRIKLDDNNGTWVRID